MTETRIIRAKVEASGNTLAGYAAVYDSESHVISEGGRTFVEVVRRGAFANLPASSPTGDVVALWGHSDARPPLGRLSAGTLRLADDRFGLHFELDAPQSAADIVEAVRRGDVSGMSFGALVPKGGDRWSKRAGGPLRELTRLALQEVSLVRDGAYPAASVGAVNRSRVVVPDGLPAAHPRRAAAARRLRLAGMG